MRAAKHLRHSIAIRLPGVQPVHKVACRLADFDCLQERGGGDERHLTHAAYAIAF